MDSEVADRPTESAQMGKTGIDTHIAHIPIHGENVPEEKSLSCCRRTSWIAIPLVHQ